MSTEPPAKRRKVVQAQEDVRIKKLAVEAFHRSIREHYIKKYAEEFLSDSVDFHYGDANQLFEYARWTPCPLTSWVTTTKHTQHVKQRVMDTIINAFVRRGLDLSPRLFSNMCKDCPTIAMAMLKHPSVNVDAFVKWSDTDLTALDFTISNEFFPPECGDLLIMIIDRANSQTLSQLTKRTGGTPLLHLMAHSISREPSMVRVFHHLLSKFENDGTGADLRPTMAKFGPALGHKLITETPKVEECIRALKARHEEIQLYQRDLQPTLFAALNNALPVRDLVALIVSYILQP